MEKLELDSEYTAYVWKLSDEYYWELWRTEYLRSKGTADTEEKAWGAAKCATHSWVLWAQAEIEKCRKEKEQNENWVSACQYKGWELPYGAWFAIKTIQKDIDKLQEVLREVWASQIALV